MDGENGVRKLFVNNSGNLNLEERGRHTSSKHYPLQIIKRVDGELKSYQFTSNSEPLFKYEVTGSCLKKDVSKYQEVLSKGFNHSEQKSYYQEIINFIRSKTKYSQEYSQLAEVLAKQLNPDNLNLEVDQQALQTLLNDQAFWESFARTNSTLYVNKGRNGQIKTSSEASGKKYAKKIVVTDNPITQSTATLAISKIEKGLVRLNEVAQENPEIFKYYNPALPTKLEDNQAKFVSAYIPKSLKLIDPEHVNDMFKVEALCLKYGFRFIDRKPGNMIYDGEHLVQVDLDEAYYETTKPVGAHSHTKAYTPIAYPAHAKTKQISLSDKFAKFNINTATKMIGNQLLQYYSLFMSAIEFSGVDINKIANQDDLKKSLWMFNPKYRESIYNFMREMIEFTPKQDAKSFIKRVIEKLAIKGLLISNEPIKGLYVGAQELRSKYAISASSQINIYASSVYLGNLDPEGLFTGNGIQYRESIKLEGQFIKGSLNYGVCSVYDENKHNLKIIDKGSFGKNNELHGANCTREIYDRDSGKLTAKLIGSFKEDKLDGEKCIIENYDPNTDKLTARITGKYTAGKRANGKLVKEIYDIETDKLASKIIGTVTNEIIDSFIHEYFNLTNGLVLKKLICRLSADNTLSTGQCEYYANEPGQKIIRTEEGTFLNGLLEGKGCTRKLYDKDSGKLVSIFTGTASNGNFSQVEIEHRDFKNTGKVWQKFYGHYNVNDKTFQGTTEYHDKHTGKVTCKEIGIFKEGKLDGENCRREIYDKDSGKWIETAAGRFLAGRFISRESTNSPLTLTGYVS